MSHVIRKIVSGVWKQGFFWQGLHHSCWSHLQYPAPKLGALVTELGTSVMIEDMQLLPENMSPITRKPVFGVCDQVRQTGLLTYRD